MTSYAFYLNKERLMNETVLTLVIMMTINGNAKFKMASLHVTVNGKSPYYRPLLCKQTTKNMNFQNLVLNFSLPDLNFQAINYRLLSALDINALRLWFKFQANPSGSFCETVDKSFFYKIDFLILFFSIYH